MQYGYSGYSSVCLAMSDRLTGITDSDCSGFRGVYVSIAAKGLKTCAQEKQNQTAVSGCSALTEIQMCTGSWKTTDHIHLLFPRNI